ncbi:AI-2E family transporter [Allosphingosinicella indica]|uniref:Predicted PurR-regulated permease PerM n=1 Tax=Allosphingosinicella indica TaxID=941907 RepID=A0A1X7GJJ5_9SPHN|nr:AI-2E family transporter [Allosphingosinicella indica]SMF70068.1 Predicted PurR-regulated permease PerM [Allosphingosinicella indica]
MTDDPGLHVEKRGPTEMRDPVIREELKRASVWIGLALAVAAVIFLAQPLLLVIGGLVFAALLDGGVRLLGRVLPIARGWRLLIVSLSAVAALVWVVYFAGYQIAAQAEMFQRVVTEQANRWLQWAGSFGFVPGNIQVDQVAEQLMGSLGRLTSAVGSLLGALTSLVMIIVIGLFVAAEPRLYERGMGWMVPIRSRERLYRTIDRMAFTLRRLMAGRLLGMAVEGIGTWLLLALGGVPLAALLGILTGLLAFLPNIGAIISGVLIILVGFSMGVETGLWAIGVYVFVQVIDGYLIVPYVARKTVDLAPALVLAAQLFFGALFGILGLALADPIVAMVKAALQQKSEEEQGKAGVAEP